MNVLFLAAYDKNEYEKILKSMEDREKMDETWDDWFLNKEGAKQKFALQGLKVVEVSISLEEITLYCLENNLPLTGDARARLATEKGKKMYS